MPALLQNIADAHAAGLPPIHVSANQGRLLYLLAKLSGARRVLEIGSLGGYSTTWLATSAPDDGRVVTLELNPHHAAVAHSESRTRRCCVARNHRHRTRCRYAARP